MVQGFGSRPAKGPDINKGLELRGLDFLLRAILLEMSSLDFHRDRGFGHPNHEGGVRKAKPGDKPRVGTKEPAEQPSSMHRVPGSFFIS